VSIILGVAGMSGSGKSTLARGLVRHYAPLASLLALDNYYRPLDHMTPEERAMVNFDHPDALDHEALIADVQRLASGEDVEVPEYDFSAHNRHAHSTHLPARPIIIVEGILALHWEALRHCYALSIFVDAPEELSLARRSERDVRERGRTLTSVHQQWEQSALPMAREFVIPSRAYADMVLSGQAPLAATLPAVISALTSRTTRR
jgi:uridine kinase